jgi:UDP-2-acetamido-3-amino-2,3-dideoxy-glucuronate N-acetyltransferase
VSVDAVAIATPAVTHYEMTKRAIEAGKDVFVEKPLAIDVEQGQVLVNLAEKMKKILMVGHILHYHPAVIKLKQLFSDGALGNVQYLYSNRLNMGKIRTEENILWSFAPHDISVMLGLLKEDPLEVTSKGGAYLSRDVVDVTLSEFLFPSGIRAHIFVSWLHPFKEQLLVVVGSEKMAVFDDTSQDKLKLYPHKVEWKNQVPVAIKAKAEIIKLEQAEPLKSECQHFLDCVINRTQPLTDGQEGLRVLKILDRCQKSLDL